MELGDSILAKKTKIEQINKEFENFLKVKRNSYSYMKEKFFDFFFLFYIQEATPLKKLLVTEEETETKMEIEH